MFTVLTLFETDQETGQAKWMTIKRTYSLTRAQILAEKLYVKDGKTVAILDSQDNNHNFIYRRG